MESLRQEAVDKSRGVGSLRSCQSQVRGSDDKSSSVAAKKASLDLSASLYPLHPDVASSLCNRT